MQQRSATTTPTQVHFPQPLQRRIGSALIKLEEKSALRIAGWRIAGWPSARDVSRERFYNYLGWLQLAAYECVFVHLWASGELSYHRGFFTDEAGEFSAQLTAYHVLQIILVPCASPPPELRKSRG